jgi:thiol-disulfide isomerase/thioredoxin
MEESVNTVLSVAVLMLCGFCVLNMALILRLSKLVREGSAHSHSGASGMAVGTPMPAVSMTTVHGLTRTGEDLGQGSVLVGFFAPGCRPCHETLPEFVAAADAVTNLDGQAFAVVSTYDNVDPESMLNQLRDHEVVMLDDPGSALLTAFQVQAFPTVIRFESGRAVATGHAAVKVPASATR